MTKRTRHARTPVKIAAARTTGTREGHPRATDGATTAGSFEEGIGRMVGLAFVAYMSRTSFQTTEKNYGHEPPSAYWVNLGKQVSDDYKAGRFGPGGPQ